MKAPPLSSGRVGGALLAASATAPFVFGLILSAPAPIELGWLMLPIVLLGFPVALLHAALLALPVYTLVRRWWQITWWNAAVAGFLIGAMPVFLLTRSVGGLAMTGASGLVAGLVFWLVLRVGRKGDAVELRRTFG